MHYLHKILVYIPYVKESCGESNNKSELINNIRMYAEHETEEYYGMAFDWRETRTAGRWESEYPENVLLAEDNVQKFVDELKTTMTNQKSYIDDALTKLKKTTGTNLEELVERQWGSDRYSFNEDDDLIIETSMLNLMNIILMLDGTYTSDSMFYNTYNKTARLYPSDIRIAERYPEDWALVMFDYHD